MKKALVILWLVACTPSDKELVDRGQRFSEEAARAALAKELTKAQFLARNNASKIELCMQVELIRRLAVDANDEDTYNAFAEASDRCP